jgi:PliI/PliC-like inhibitor of I-type lysozyme
MQTTIIGSLLLLFTALGYGPERNFRFVKKIQIPGSTEVVVVAEGDFEPRSTGSYSLRIYGGASKKFPTDDFVAGLVRPRNGTVEAVRFDDIDGDDKPEVVVIIRSAGSGGYVSADAFRYRNRSIEFIGSVSDLDKKTDPIQALRDKLKAHENGSPGDR